ncbi:MAG: hypothetical protein CMJ79_15240 [Planctomycetaceae bacterium]|nr:hypothetical protein [Planctomycetaceae bacterium]MBK97048.1 hypothetical protein [Planctomycetaceae bacterium]|tara:strand:- start:859 stop:2937 length:2079 start_codon:yes stop_codon:yes gene_type:complete
MRFLFMAVALTGLLFSLESPMTVDAKEPDFDEISGWIERQLDYTGDPGLAVAVVKDGEIVFADGFGWSDKEKRRRANEHTSYSIASISKPITATAIQKLVAAGKLDVDQPANTYLGKAKIKNRFGEDDAVTVRQLLNHTSGLGLHYQFYYGVDGYPVPDRDTTIDHYGITTRPPAESYYYCNLGYGILDYIIARQSDQTYAEYTQQHVFDALAMEHSFIGLPAVKQKNVAVRYDRQGAAIPLYEFDHDGGSAVYASAYDLARFALLHLEDAFQEVLEPKWVQQMKEPTAQVGTNRGYGMGWLIETGEHYIVSHTGGMPGVATRLTLVPEHNLGVVCLSNTESNLPHRTVKKILSETLDDYPYDHPNLLLRPRRRSTPAFNPSPELQGTWVGEIQTYEGPRQLQLWIGNDGSCRARLEGQLVTLVSDPKLTEGLFTGMLNGDLQTSDTSRVKHRLRLRLTIRNGQLTGAVEAVTNMSTRWIGGEKVIPRAYYGLSHYTTLKKISTVGSQQTLFNGRNLDGWEIVKKYDFKNHGSIQVNDGVIQLGKGSPASGIKVAGPFPKMNYEVELEARRVDGNDFFCGLTFPIHDTFCTLVIGGWGGGVVGLSNIDTMAAVENETTSYLEVEDNRWYKITLRVSEERIQVWIDNAEYANVKTKEHKFDIWWEQEPARPFGLVSWNTRAEFRNIRIKPSGW